MNEDILIPISFFALVFGIVYLSLMVRNKERMALIEKGASADLFNKHNKDGKMTLKLGILAIGVGIGIVVANLFVSAQMLKDEVAFPSMIFLFGGIGLVVSYYLTASKKEESN